MISGARQMVKLTTKWFYKLNCPSDMSKSSSFDESLVGLETLKVLDVPEMALDLFMPGIGQWSSSNIFDHAMACQALKTHSAWYHLQYWKLYGGLFTGSFGQNPKYSLLNCSKKTRVQFKRTPHISFQYFFHNSLIQFIGGTTLDCIICSLVDAH